MPEAKPKKPYKDSESQLLLLGIRNKGFERYEGTEALIEGLKSEDFRWKVTFKNTGQEVKCSTLVECVNLIKATTTSV